ncbi:MAG: hypothetical protein IJE68_03255 [Clostridia bacterium]|nr:hypothetical protein [Clostridia bacterium]
MNIQNEINNNINQEKNNFLNTVIGQTINNAIDIGLKSVLPDLIENQVIEIKDALLKNGLKEGIQTAVDSAIDFGKSTIGIFTGNFENVTQVRTAVADGGIIDTMSNLLDKVINKTYESGYINSSVTRLIRNGKDILLENISSNIKNELDEQNNVVEKLGRYIDNWKEYYNNKDFEGMTKEYNKIKNKIDNVIPLENILKETRKVEMLHNLIKNNGQNFEITNLENELIEKLSI